MTPLFLLISMGLVWVNLAGLALLCDRLLKDYAVSRIGSILGLCLFFFFLEHFHGFGPRLWFMPFSSLASAWLVWSDREKLRDHLFVEGAFGAGFIYCMAWRYAFPDIDLFEERIPDLVMIHNYFPGTLLPALDRWMPPLTNEFYYGFQFYSAALLGRWFGLEPGLAYQFAYGVMGGLIGAAVFTAARRLSPWRPAAWVLTVALMLGGCGLGLVVHLAMKHSIEPLEMVRYLGMVWPPQHRTAVGTALDAMMYTKGVNPVELPVEPLSYLLVKGEFHPPLIGFLVLAYSLLVIATLDAEAIPRRRGVFHALLAASIPLALIGNTWVFPLQAVLVLGWFVYRGLAGEKAHWAAGLFGAGAASVLAYPFLVRFLQASASHLTTLAVTPAGAHATVVEWLSVFWPLVGLLLLAPLNRERRGLAAYFASVWLLLLALTEIFYNHDINSGTWMRFNSTLKWWGWIYAGGVLTVGGLNLSARSRLCRYGSVALLLLPCAMAYDYGCEFLKAPRASVGHLDGTDWLTRDVALRDIVSALKARPDGICLDSNLIFANTDATVLGLFANKQAYMGWPVQEGIWREFRTEIRDRRDEVEMFFAGRMADPLTWLLKNDVRYVLWLQKDNDNRNARFLPLEAKIRSRYVWRHYAGNDGDWAVGFWERVDAGTLASGPPPPPHPAGP